MLRYDIEHQITDDEPLNLLFRAAQLHLQQLFEPSRLEARVRDRPGQRPSNHDVPAACARLRSVQVLNGRDLEAHACEIKWRRERAAQPEWWRRCHVLVQR